MKINLPNYLCIDFQIHSDFAVSRTIAAAIRSVVDQTSNHTHATTSSGVREATVGVFGSRFVSKGIRHRAIGNLAVGEKDGEPWVDIWLVNRADDSVPRPPRAIKPVSLMSAVISEKCQPARADNVALFRYDPAEGWDSKISLPMPMLLPSDPPGITHIESAEFSRRDDEGVQYRVIVDKDVDETKILHSVSFTSTIEWSNVSFRRSLNYARTISAQLVSLKQGGGHGTGTTDC